MSSTVQSAIQTRRMKNTKLRIPQPQAQPQQQPQPQPQPQPQAQPQPQPQPQSIAQAPLPPASTPAWLRSRPKNLKNIVNRPTSAAMKKRLESAKARQIKKAAEQLPENPYLDEIIVFDERVILNEEGVPAYILQADANLDDTVYFTPSYFPNEKNLDKIKLAKTVFSKVFLPGSKFSLENPVPPCETTESSLLIEGLQNHLYVLRKNLPQGYEEIYSMNVRNIFERAKKIKLVLEKFEDDNTLCTRYDVDFDTNEPLSVKGYGGKQTTNIDRERVQNLLRQFSFLILQGMHPIPGHEDKVGNISPDFLLNALEQNTISKEEMDEYIAEYTESSKADIPDIIVHTLEATDTQDNVYSLMLESELSKLISYIKEMILNGLNDEILKKNFIKHNESQEGLPLKDEITGILKWIMKEYTNHKKIADDNRNTLIANKSAHENLYASASDNQTKILELESKLLAAEMEINKYATNPSTNKESSGIDPKVNANISQLQKTISEFKNTLVQRTGERDTIAKKLDTLNRSSQTAATNIKSAQQVAGTLGRVLKVASNPKDISLLKRVEEIATAVQNKEVLQLDENSAFNELYSSFESNNDSQMSAVCYLTYFVKFCINNIFRDDTDLYQILNKIIDEYLKTDEDIDRAIEDLKYLLESVEGDKILKTGCYLLNKGPTKLLNDLYEKMNENPELNERCIRALNYTFQNYNRSSIYYIPHDFITESVNNGIKSFRNMFFIKPFNKRDNINIYDESGNIINDSTIKTEKIFENTSLPYATVFIFYVLFSRKYLLSEGDKQRCPLPKSLTRESLIFKKSKLTHSGVVKN